MSNLNWDKVNDQKKRLDEKLSKGGGSGAKFFKPRDGENRLRLMPGWTDEGDFAGQFWREVAQHWNVSEDQKGPILCPKNTPYMSGECPICSLVEKLKSQKGDVKAQELVKDLRAKTAYLLNVVDVKDAIYTAADMAEFKKNRPDADVPFEVGDAKVQVYAAPSTVFNQILNVIQVNDMDITCPAGADGGRDILLKKSGKGLKTRYETTIIIKATDAPEAQSNPLDDIGFTMDTDEMLNLLSTGPGGDYFALLPSSGVGAPEVDTDTDSEDLYQKLLNAQ